MKTEIRPEDTPRASAFQLWMSSPMPMVTLVKTLNVSRLVKLSHKTGMKFTMLMGWCIGKAASQVEEFYTLPEEGKLFRYDRIAINTIVQNRRGGLNFCDIAFTEDLHQFNSDYLKQTLYAAKECMTTSLDGYMLIGTSAVVETELDAIINQYSGFFNNPFLSWGRYHKGLLSTTLPVSFQFHHVQMDGMQAARFLNLLQEAMNDLRW